MAIKRFADKDVNNASFFPPQKVLEFPGEWGWDSNAQQGKYEATILEKSNEKLRPPLPNISMMKKWQVLLCA